MENKFRITKNVWYTPSGDEILLSYHVQKLKSFLGIKYWSSVKKDTNLEPIYFKDLKSAENFVETKLLRNIPIDKYVSSVVRVY